MRFGRLLLVLGFPSISFAAACSAGEQSVTSERVASTSEAITTSCTIDTLEQPCDPDGPAGPLFECEGICVLNGLGAAVCSKLSVVGVNDGLVCGTIAAVGDVACTRHCLGKTCLAQNAAAGVACRPSATSSPCDGECDGAGKCAPINAACAFGRDQQLCTFKSCDYRNAQKCATWNIQAGIPCSDFDACTIGACGAGGVCVAGPTKGCDDGNPCTDDSCDSTSGGCIGTPDDTNKCSDNNACTVGDSCSGGTCKPGVPRNCDDANPCTVDSCDPVNGCVHTPLDCNDKNACTTDSCDVNSGQCTHASANCDDGDACTVDSCDVQLGCSHKALSCDDGDACTADSCTGGICSHGTMACDDANSCTDDSCNSGSGCVFTPIAGCGSGGGAASGGAANGGASTAGTSATSGASSSDTAGSGGAAGVTNGGATNGGATNGGATNGGATNGGATNGGATNGGNSGAPDQIGGVGASGGVGGALGAGASTGVSSTEAGASDGGTSSAPSKDSGGCGCEIPRSNRRQVGGWAAGFLAGLFVWRRRRLTVEIALKS